MLSNRIMNPQSGLKLHNLDSKLNPLIWISDSIC